MRTTVRITLFLIAAALLCAACGNSTKPSYTPRGPVNEFILNEARTETRNAFDSYERGLYEQSLVSYENVLNKLHLIDNQEEIAFVRHNMANTLIALGKLDRAEKELRLSLKANESFGLGPRVAANQGSLGTIYEAKGQLDPALAYYREALETLKKNKGGAVAFARQYNNCGFILLKQGKHEEAMKEFELARKYAAPANAYLELGTAFSGIGKCQSALGKHELAKPAFLDALTAHKAAEAPLEIAANLKDLSRTYEKLGEREEAIDHGERALRINDQFKLLERLKTDYDDLLRLHAAAGNTGRIKELIDEISVLMDFLRTTGNTAARQEFRSIREKARALPAE